MRRIRTILTATSLLLCLATSLLWLRSYATQDLLELHRRGDARGRDYDDIHGVFSGGGSVGIGFVHVAHPGVPGFTSGWHAATAQGPIPWTLRFNLLGFKYWNTILTRTSTGPVHVAGITVPHGLFTVLFAIAPLLAFRKRFLLRRRLRRAAAGLCCACGFDLRATPGRCPECGEIPA